MHCCLDKQVVSDDKCPVEKLQEKEEKKPTQYVRVCVCVCVYVQSAVTDLILPVSTSPAINATLHRLRAALHAVLLDLQALH